MLAHMCKTNLLALHKYATNKKQVSQVQNMDMLSMEIRQEQLWVKRNFLLPFQTEKVMTNSTLLDKIIVRFK